MPSRTNVAVMTVPMIEEFPDVINDNIVRGILKGQSAAESVIEALTHNFSHAVDRYVQYGKTQYTPGLPQGDMTVGFVPLVPIFDILNTLEGEPVNIITASYETPEVDRIALQYIRDNHGYNPLSGIVQNPSFVPAGVVTFVDATFQDATGQVLISFLDGAVPKDVAYTIPGASIAATTYNVEYFVANDVAQTTLYWTYNPELGTHADLSVGTALYTDSTYLPVIELRQDKVNLVDTADTELLRTTTKMMKTLGMDIDSITDSIMENPDVDSIFDVAVLFAANIQTESPVTLKYLFDYFLTLSIRTKSTKQLWDNSLSYNFKQVRHTLVKTLAHRPTTKISIADRDTRMQLEFNYIDVQIIEGNLGVVGTTTRENIATPAQFKAETSQYILRHQISATHYQQVLVHGLLHTGRPHANKVVVTDLAGSLLDDAIFYIPVVMTVANSFTDKSLVRAELYYDCMVMLIHAVSVQHWEWYEDPKFFALIQVSLVIVAIITFQPEIATLGELLIFIGTNIAIKVTADWLVNTVGGELALILAAVATIYAAYTGNFDVVLVSMPSAITLLQVILAVTVSIGGHYEDKIEDLGAEAETVAEEQERLTEQLVASQDLLDTNGNIDPLYVLEKRHVWMPEEGPEAFYFRTLHNNPGLIGFDALRGWHDSALQLPRGLDLTNKYV